MRYWKCRRSASDRPSRVPGDGHSGVGRLGRPEEVPLWSLGEMFGKGRAGERYFAGIEWKGWPEMTAHNRLDDVLAGAGSFPAAGHAFGMLEAEIGEAFDEGDASGARVRSVRAREWPRPNKTRDFEVLLAAHAAALPVLNRPRSEITTVLEPELESAPFRRLVQLADLGKRIDRLVIGDGPAAAWISSGGTPNPMPALDTRHPVPGPNQAIAVRAEVMRQDDIRNVDYISRPDWLGARYEPSLALVASQIRTQQMARLARRPAATGSQIAEADGRHLTLEGAIQDAQPVTIHDFFYEPAYEPVEIPAHRSALRGRRVRLGRSRAEIAVGEGGTSLDIRNRSAALTFGVPGSGFFYRIRLTSSRIQAYAPAAEGSPWLGPWPVLLAMIAAGVMLFWSLAPRNASQWGVRAAAAQREMPIAVTPAALPAPQVRPPTARAQAVPPVREPQVAAPVQAQQNAAAPTPVAAPPQERVATSKIANIRARPDIKASVARVVPAKVILTVFEKKDGWLQVGSTYPWGWVHSSFIYRYDPPS
jgi:hypothetical protein